MLACAGAYIVHVWLVTENGDRAHEHNVAVVLMYQYRINGTTASVVLMYWYRIMEPLYLWC